MTNVTYRYKELKKKAKFLFLFEFFFEFFVLDFIFLHKLKNNSRI